MDNNGSDRHKHNSNDTSSTSTSTSTSNNGRREDIVLDPDGDVTLVLQKRYAVDANGVLITPHSSSGASGSNNGAGTASVPPPLQPLQKSGVASILKGMSPKIAAAAAGVGSSTGATAAGAPGHGSASGSSGGSAGGGSASFTSRLGSPPRPKSNELLQVHALVSSKHLMLASSVFRAMLRPRHSAGSSIGGGGGGGGGASLAEASTLQHAGRVEIPLPEDDLDAMVIILRIIHHRYGEVSRHISRSLLAQVAVLVDKYDLRKSVEFVSTTWFDNFGLGKKRGTLLPAKFCDELLEWLFISWVFGHAEIFFGMTRIAMAQSWCRLDNDSLAQFPFPGSLIETIDSRRQHSIAKILSVYESHISASWGDGSGRVSCPAEIAECDAKVLGTLLRAGRQLSIYPIPKPPFPGISFTDLHRDLDRVEVPTCGEHYYYNRTDFNDALNQAIKGEFAEGLLLRNFVAEGE